MAASIHVPRINNNDDEVKLVELRVTVGDRVQAGQVVASVETDKAVVDVESATEGHVLAVLGTLDAQVRVGSVLIWLGATADEAVPAAAVAEPVTAAGPPAGAATAKALALLHQYGLSVGDVPASGGRLSAEAVLRHVQASGLQPRPGPSRGNTGAHSAVVMSDRADKPDMPGTARPLRNTERGMLNTVRWQRDFAVPGYVEMAYDAAAWDRHAAAFGHKHQLLLNPLLALLAWRLVQLAVATPKFNATIAGDHRHEYDRVNLGFTVQSGEVLYLAVLRDAATLDELGFANRLVDLQRRAAGHLLEPSELQGATIGFSSMARWKVARHVPILSPHTALMVAHSVAPDGGGVLAATYDHRVLHGGEVAAILRKLGNAPAAVDA